MTDLLEVIVIILLLLTATAALRLEIDARSQPQLSGVDTYVFVARVIVAATGLAALVFGAAFYFL